MSTVDDLKTGLLHVIEGLRELGSPARRVSEGWSQAAASVASLAQGSTNPMFGEIAAFVGQAAQASFELEGRTVAAEEMINDLIASL